MRLAAPPSRIPQVRSALQASGGHSGLADHVGLSPSTIKILATSCEGTTVSNKQVTFATIRPHYYSELEVRKAVYKIQNEHIITQQPYLSTVVDMIFRCGMMNAQTYIPLFGYTLSTDITSSKCVCDLASN